MANNAAFGNRLVTTTRDKMLAKCVDTVLNSNILALRLLSKSKKWSGASIQVPIKYAKNTTGGSFSGLDTFSTSVTDNRVKAQFFPSFVHIDSVLPLTELSVNENSDQSEAIINLMSITLQSDTEDLADLVGDQMYGDGTGNSNKDILGLGAAVDDGTVTPTYGGLSRVTYPTFASTVTASGGTISLDKLSALHDAVSSGTITPTLGVTTKAVFSLLEKLFVPQDRISKSVDMMRKGMTVGGGATAIFWRGVEIVADEKCPAGKLFLINEKYMDWYALPMAETVPIKYKRQIEGNDYEDTPVGYGFSFSDWITPTNAAAKIGHIYLGGNLVNRDPKRSGVLTGITGV